jgi:hypothetical protein
LPLTASGTIWTACPPQPDSSNRTTTASSTQRPVPGWQTRSGTRVAP